MEKPETKTNCFAYRGQEKSIPYEALKELYCAREKCNFYQNKDLFRMKRTQGGEY